MENEPKLIGVTATFFYQENGKEIEVHADFNHEMWNQWGAPKELLSANVRVVEAVDESLQEFMRVSDEV